MTDEIKLQGDSQSLQKALDHAVAAFKRYYQNVEKIEKVAGKFSNGGKKLEGTISAQLAGNQRLTTSFEKLGDVYRITAQSMETMAEKKVRASNRVSDATKRMIAAEKRAAEQAKAVAAKEATKTAKITGQSAEAVASTRLEQERVKLLRDEVSLSKQKEATLRSAHKLERERLATQRAVLSTINKLIQLEQQRLSIAERAAMAAERERDRMVRMAIVKAQIESKENIAARNQYLRQQALYQGQQRLALAQQRFNQQLETANKGAQQFLITWQGVARIMLISAGYRAFTALSNQIRQGITNALEFQKAVAGVRTISQDADLTTRQWADGLQRVSDGWRLDIIEQAEAAYQALTNQVAKGTQVFNFLEEANRFATATFVETNEAVRIAASAINAYGLQVEDTSRIFASFFKTIELGRLRGGELTEIGRVLLPGRQLGVELDEINAAISTLSIQGVKANEAMTFLRGIFQKLIRPTEAMKGFFAELGVSTGEAAIQIFGFEGFLKKLETRFEGSSDELGELFNRVRALAGIFGLSGSALEKYGENLEKIRGSADSYNEAVKRVSETSQQQLEVALSRVRNIFTRLGSDVLDTAAAWTNGFKGVETITRELIPLLKTGLIVAIGGVTTAVFLLGKALLASPIGLLITGLTTAIYTYNRLAQATELFNMKLQAESAEAVRAHQDSVRKRLDAEAKFRAERDELIKDSFRGIQQAQAEVVAEANRLFTVQTGFMSRTEKSISRFGTSIKKIMDDTVKATEKSLEDLVKDFDSLIDDMVKSRRTTQETLFDWELEDKKGQAALDMIRAELNTLSRQISTASGSELSRIESRVRDLLGRERSMQRAIAEENKKIGEQRLDIEREMADAQDEYNRKMADAQAKQTKDAQGRVDQANTIIRLTEDYNRLVTDLQQKERALVETRVTERNIAAQTLNYDARIFAQRQKLAAQSLLDQEEASRKLAEQQRQQTRLNFLLEQASNFKVKDILELEDPALQQRALENQIRALEELRNLGKELGTDDRTLDQITEAVGITTQSAALQILKQRLELSQRNLDLEQRTLQSVETRAKTEEATLRATSNTFQEQLTNFLRLEGHIYDSFRSSFNWKVGGPLGWILGGRLQTADNIREVERRINQTLKPLRALSDDLRQLSGADNVRVSEFLGDPDNIQKTLDNFAELDVILRRQGLNMTGLQDLRQLFASGDLNQITRLIELEAGRLNLENQRLTLEERLAEATGQSSAATEAARPILDRMRESTEKYNQTVRDTLILLREINALTPAIDAAQRLQIQQQFATPESLAHGGKIRGRDTVNARLEPGEMVLNRKASNSFYSQLVGMNSMRGSPSKSAGTTVNGDFNITMTPSGNTQTDVVAIGRALRREIQRGTVKLQ